MRQTQIDISGALIGAAETRSAAAAKPVARDPRLDFFRGLAMFIILVSHTPYNWLAGYLPSRFGFSDAAEIFVFCSGMASAIAFGGTFNRAGAALGTARVLQRMWQVYWAHIGLFFALVFLLTAVDNTGLYAKSYVETLNIHAFYRNVPENLVGLFTLTYVPNYFDILPMYLVILAMIPVVMMLARGSPLLVAAACLASWTAASMGYLSLPAEPWSHRSWYFNPFAWQIVFFTGFAFMRGWLPRPPVTRRLIIVACAILFISMLLDYVPILRAVPLLADIAGSLGGLEDKTNEGVLRYVHFLALAYLAWVAVGENGCRLVANYDAGPAARLWGNIVKTIQIVGQQSLAVFVCAMIASRILGFGLDLAGPTLFTVTLANIVGFAFIILVALVTGWFKSQPWRKVK